MSGGRPRAFDHDRARELRAAGWTYTSIAGELGVSDVAVIRACDPAYRERSDRAIRERLEQMRQPCLGGCGALVWMHNAGRSGYCVDCFNEQLVAGDVREDAMRCRRCGEWKPDEDFMRQPGRKVRRGRRSECRACESARRRENRRANIEREREYGRQRYAQKKAA